ncbi:hypothetical protein AA14362_1938 [Acetobacter cerevisiae DSM 14362]|nr:hypothetical protein AA14362_1938 [Acetobacter cerevisiae DSM 14362]
MERRLCERVVSLTPAKPVDCTDKSHDILTMSREWELLDLLKGCSLYVAKSGQGCPFVPRRVERVKDAPS